MKHWYIVKFTEVPQNIPLRTKIDDEKGERNVQILTKRGNLWYATDGLYVYYTPTHWQYI
jgi:hypothetical protein